MLCVSRKRDDSIYIGEGKDRVIVTVVSIQGGRVKLGITAAPEVHVVRSELKTYK